ncbi:unnamed protein product, partial [Iphiclides podalirius]
MNWLFLLLPSMLHFASSYRILAVFPVVTRSHYLTGRRIIFGLLNKGHEIVSISPYEEAVNLVNFTWVPVEVKSIFESVPNLEQEINRQYNFFSYQSYVWRTMNIYANHIINQPKLRDFIENDESRFDLILAEEFFLPLFYAFAHKYRAPMVITTPYGVAQYVNEFTGNPLEMWRATHEFLELTVARNAYERAMNFVCTVFDIVGRRQKLVSYQDRLARDVFKNVPNLPHLSDLERNVDLVLVNSHFSLMDVMPNLPHVIEIGGVHIEDVKPLGKELQSLLDGATKGVVLFSFGSILNLDSQSEEFINKTLTVLGELEQKVIVKWDSKRKISGAYKNIFPYKWLPQNDVLAHPNLVLFITHGGLLSLYEAVYHRVPVVCVPLQASQPKNCLRVTEMGLGVHLKTEGLTSASFKQAVVTVLSDPTYAARVAALSARFKDRLMPPLDTAVYWIEHCAKFRGVVPAKPPKNYRLCDDLFDLAVALIVLLLTLLSVRKLISAACHR